jgi:hypothetical protein
MKKRTWLTKTIAILVLVLLVGAGAGYASEYYQGRGELEIDPEFDGFHSIHALIMMSNGSLEVDEDITVGDGMTADIEGTADGSYNSVHEVTVWINADVQTYGYTQSEDGTNTHYVEANGVGMFVNNASSDTKLKRENHIIILHNKYD